MRLFGWDVVVAFGTLALPDLDPGSRFWARSASLPAVTVSVFSPATVAFQLSAASATALARDRDGEDSATLQTIGDFSFTLSSASSVGIRITEVASQSAA